MRRLALRLQISQDDRKSKGAILTMPRLRFFEWNFDLDTVIEYERTGDCNGCGACCLHVIKWQVFQRSKRQEQSFKNGMAVDEVFSDGVWTEFRTGSTRRFFWGLITTDEAHRCPALTEDKRCSVHTGKSQICSVWPLTPKDIAPFPECSYQFREVSRQKISEVDFYAAS
jgi:Fe-S-cluster containining protein